MGFPGPATINCPRRISPAASLSRLYPSAFPRVNRMVYAPERQSTRMAIAGRGHGAAFTAWDAEDAEDGGLRVDAGPSSGAPFVTVRGMPTQSRLTLKSR